MKTVFVTTWEIVKILVVASLIVAPIRYFVFQPFFVKGQSMEPNFDNGNYLIVDELSYRLRSPERGEVVVFKYPNDPSQRYIKRIIGLPKETVEIKNQKIIVTDKDETKVLDESPYLPPSIVTLGEIRVVLGENQYFVLGDNRQSSSDSRRWGPLPREDIIGRVLIRVWPFASVAKFAAPVY